MFDYTILKYEGGFNSKVKTLEEDYYGLSGRKYNVAVNSATSAADILFSYLYSEYGPLKITCPTLSFCSPVMMALRNGHHIKFVDVNIHLNQAYYGDFNMPVLYGGSALSIQHSDVVDSAHNPVYVHASADYIFTSFFPTKPLKCFTGGMLSSYNEVEYFARYRNFGRADEVVQAGNKYYMDGFNASIVLDNMKTYDSGVQLRKRNLELYSDLVEFGSIVKHDPFSSYYLGSLVLDKPVAQQLRNLFFVDSKLHYPLLHKQTFFKDNNNCSYGNCDYANYIAPRLFTLPICEHYEPYQIKLFKEEIVRCLRSL
jgi:dTDP-4-amino-4,6-dideoxygalactose transaminase